MKNILITLFLIIIMCSCDNSDADLNNKGYKYTVIDTTHISVNGFNTILGYNVIIEVDSALFSAWMDTNGVITKLDRKLKLRK